LGDARVDTFEIDDEYRPPLVRGLPDRLDDAAHARCMLIALAAVEAGRGEVSRFAPAPQTTQ